MKNKNYTFRVAKETGQANGAGAASSVTDCRPRKGQRDKKEKTIKVYCTREDREKFQRYCADQNISCSVYLGKVIRRLTRKMQL